jgi:hypothetical protein
MGAPAAALLTVSSSAAAAPRVEGARAASKGEEAPVAAPREEPKKIDLVFLEAETGAQYVGLETLSVKRDVVPTASRKQDVGAFLGAGAGVKLVFLSVGPHFRFGHFQDWDLWTLDLDLGFHAPLGAIEPLVRLGGGYARLERAFDRLQNGQYLHAFGYHLALTLGADYFATRALTIGMRVSGDLLALQRAGVDLNAQDGLVNDYLKYDGAAAGLGITGALGLGLHF